MKNTVGLCESVCWVAVKKIRESFASPIGELLCVYTHPYSPLL